MKTTIEEIRDNPNRYLIVSNPLIKVNNLQQEFNGLVANVLLLYKEIEIKKLNNEKTFHDDFLIAVLEKIADILDYLLTERKLTDQMYTCRNRHILKIKQLKSFMK